MKEFLHQPFNSFSYESEYKLKLFHWFRRPSLVGPLLPLWLPLFLFSLSHNPFQLHSLYAIHQNMQCPSTLESLQWFFPLFEISFPLSYIYNGISITCYSLCLDVSCSLRWPPFENCTDPHLPPVIQSFLLCPITF